MPAGERDAELLADAGEDVAAQPFGGDEASVDPAVGVRGAEAGRYHRTQREDGQQRDHVREAFVEGRLIGQAGAEEAAAQAVQHGVGGLVGDHVVGEAGVDRVVAGLRHVAEEQGAIVGGVVGVRLAEGVRHQVQLMAGEGPGQPASQGGLEGGEGAGSDGVDLLGVEADVGQQLLVGGGGEEVAVRGQVGRGLQHAGRGVEVDHLEA